MHTRLIIGAALMLSAFAVISIVTYFSNNEAYYTVDELVGNPALYHHAPSADTVMAAEKTPTGRRMQVRGTIDKASVNRAKEGLQLKFTISGKDNRLPVEYEGMVPDTFDMATQVTVGGRAAADGTFIADQLSVQCPSKYEAVPPGETPKPVGGGLNG
jgi:cytochrome c-type biogenesis protein CcmE